MSMSSYVKHNTRDIFSTWNSEIKKEKEQRIYLITKQMCYLNKNTDIRNVSI